MSRLTLGSSTGFYTYDPSGNASQRINGTSPNVGVPAVSYVTDAFGLVTSSDASGVTFGFAGQFGGSQDSEDGFVLMGHRYYDPGAGRFLTRDPISYNGGVNLYSYTQNDPLNENDPSGLSAWYDDLAQWAASGAQYQKNLVNNYWAGNGAGVGVATVTNTAIDLVAGIVQVPSDIGHLGEGTGCFAANPSLETAPGLINDIIVADSVLLAGTVAAKPLAYGPGIDFRRYPNAGGGGINFYDASGNRRFAVDYHKFKLNGVEKPRLHYHSGNTKSQMGKHRPWQGGWQ